jgi:uncharacterized protein (DUF2062 family)
LKSFIKIETGIRPQQSLERLFNQQRNTDAPSIAFASIPIAAPMLTAVGVLVATFPEFGADVMLPTQTLRKMILNSIQLL